MLKPLSRCSDTNSRATNPDGIAFGGWVGCWVGMLVACWAWSPVDAEDFRTAEQRTDPAKRPNIVFFLVDDLGWTDLSCFGSSFYETPNVDRLAAMGMKFTRGYAACPVCSPTRASILTGRYPVRTEITDYINPARGNQPENWKRKTQLLPAPFRTELRLAERTLAESLKDAGYATFFAGKWHLGGQGFYPEDQGFDVNRGGIELGGPYGGKRYFSPYGNPRLEDGPEGEHLPDRLATETVQFIKEHADQPFFAYVSFYSVHTPLIAREDLRQKYLAKRQAQGLDAPLWAQEGARRVRLVQQHAVYAAMVEAMDLAVGKVMEGLRTAGVAEETMIVFFSDNGGLSTSEGHPTSNLPLRAGKGWMYEGGIREPMIVYVPGTTEAGAVCSQPVISTDFYPTLLELAGLPLEPDAHVDGVSLVPLLKGQPLQRGPLFWHYPHYGNQGGAPSGAVMDGPWKLIQWFEDDRLELFNVESDPSEAHDLAQEKPEQAQTLLRQLTAWREETGAIMPQKRQN